MLEFERSQAYVVQNYVFVCILLLVGENCPVVVVMDPADISPDVVIVVIPFIAVLFIDRFLQIVMPLLTLNGMK